MKYKTVILLMFVVVLSSCALKKEVSNDLTMDVPAEDGKYHYTNKDMGFSVTFPEEFIYYQFQRVSSLEYTDLEFFVPTNDLNYPQEIKSYAKPVIIRVYEKNAYDTIDKNGGMGLAFEKIGENEENVYLLKFWDKIPKDWGDKWNEDLKSQIKNSFVAMR